MMERRLRLPLFLAVVLVAVSRVNDCIFYTKRLDKPPGERISKCEEVAVSAASWIEVDSIVDKLNPLQESTTGSINSPSVRVWLSRGECGILVAVREDGLDCPPPPESAGSCPPYSQVVGLQNQEGTWKYRRAFGGCFDCTTNTDGMIIDASNNTRHACSQSTFRALSDETALKPEACSQVSSARAWWLDEEKAVYGLLLTPFECNRCAPSVSIFGGMDHCQRPLEVMGEKELKPPVKDTLGCVYPSNADVRPLATVRVPPTLLNDDLPLTGARWTEDGARWEVFNPGETETIRQSARQQKHPDTKASQNSVESLCLIGDSHFYRIRFDIFRAAWDLFQLDTRHVKYLVNFLMSGGFQAPARHNISVKEDVELCHEWMQSLGNGTGVIILSAGSHQPRASMDNLTNFVHDLEAFLKHQPSNHHVLVGSTFDSCHGNIPRHFHTENRIGQNTWREQAKAAAMQRAIEKSSLENLHYVDLFTPSAALHFGHCSKGDPVHWIGGGFYQETVRILLEAVRSIV